MPKLPCPTKPNTCPISQMTTYTIAQQLLHTPRVIQFQPPPSILPDRREKMTYFGHLNRGSTSMNKGEKRRLPLVSRNSEVNRRPRRSIQTLGGINLLGTRLHLKVAKVRIREYEVSERVRAAVSKRHLPSYTVAQLLNTIPAHPLCILYIGALTSNLSSLAQLAPPVAVAGGDEIRDSVGRLKEGGVGFVEESAKKPSFEEVAATFDSMTKHYDFAQRATRGGEMALRYAQSS